MNKDNESNIPDGPSVEELTAQVEKLEAEKNEYLAGWQRAKADYLNYKKEENKRLQDVAKYTSEDLMREMVTILDNFDLGLRALEKSGQVDKGVYLIRAQIADVLKKRGLEQIHIPSHQEFDPAIAEAIAETESSEPPGTIIEIIEPGYRLYEKVIRPARVILSKGTQTNNQTN